MDEVSVYNKQAFVESVADACVRPAAENDQSIEEMISNAKAYNKPEPDEVKSTTPRIR